MRWPCLLRGIVVVPVVLAAAGLGVRGGDIMDAEGEKVAAEAQDVGVRVVWFEEDVFARVTAGSPPYCCCGAAGCWMEILVERNRALNLVDFLNVDCSMESSRSKGTPSRSVMRSTAWRSADSSSRSRA